MFTPLNELAKEVNANARDKGWWDTERELPEIIALIHTEVSEAFEEYRNGHKLHEIYYPNADGHGPIAPDASIGRHWAENFGWKPEGIPIELADVIIRILDFAGYHKIDLDEAVRLKMAYNKTRPHRHGGKLA